MVSHLSAKQNPSDVLINEKIWYRERCEVMELKSSNFNHGGNKQYGCTYKVAFRGDTLFSEIVSESWIYEQLVNHENGSGGGFEILSVEPV